MDTAKLTVCAPVHTPVQFQTPSQLMAFDPDAVPSWDAMCEAVSLSDIAQDELLGDPYAALADDGIDGYSGADSVLDGSHDHALMLVGFAMMENDEHES